MPILGTAQNASAKLACDCAGVFQISKIGKLHFCLLTIQLLEYPPKNHNYTVNSHNFNLAAVAHGPHTTWGARKKLKQLGLLGCGGFGAVELVQHVTWVQSFSWKVVS